MITEKNNKIFSTQNIKEGQIIHYICCKESTKPTPHTIFVNREYYVIDKVASKINHSFAPNVEVKGHNIISLQNIKKGQELKRNLYDTEEVILEPFTDKETGEIVDTKNLYLYRDTFEDIDDNDILRYGL